MTNDYEPYLESYRVYFKKIFHSDSGTRTNRLKFGIMNQADIKRD
jgi:hypothetical protein